MIKVLFFAQIKDVLGVSELVINADNIKTVSDIADEIAKDYPKWELVSNTQPCLCAVNQTLTDFSNPVKSGDEVAFFPPVTGG